MGRGRHRVLFITGAARTNVRGDPIYLRRVLWQLARTPHVTYTACAGTRDVPVVFDTCTGTVEVDVSYTVCDGFVTICPETPMSVRFSQAMAYSAAWMSALAFVYNYLGQRELAKRVEALVQKNDLDESDDEDAPADGRRRVPKPTTSPPP